MKLLFWIGLATLILGVLSLFVPVPHKDRAEFKAGGLSLGVESRHDEKLPPLASAVMILGGAGVMIAGQGMKRSK
jgi:hypothetical protein